MSEIKTFEEACEKLGHDPKAILPDLSPFPEKHQKALLANAKLTIIAEASRDGKKVIWTDRSRKWAPWFDMEKDKNNPSGFRFDGSYYEISATATTGGSRLCYNTEEESDYHGKRHEDLYRDMMVIPD